MGDILSIIEFNQHNPENIIWVVLIGIILLGVFLLSHEIKEKLILYVTHRRNRYHFLYLILSGGGLFCLYYFRFISTLGLALCSALWMLYFVLMLYPFVYQKSVPSIFLRNYTRYLERGLTLEYLDDLEANPPCWIFDMDDQIQYQLLRASYYSHLDQHERAHEILKAIPEAHLVERERDLVQKRRAHALWEMCNTDAMLQILGSPDENKSKDPFVWMHYSNMMEANGDLDQAFFYAKKARALLETTQEASVETRAQILSNYGRIYGIMENEEECRRYYGMAYQIIKDSSNIKALHIIASNYVIALSREKKYREQALAVLEEYRGKIPVDSIDNLMEYHNTAIVVHRQLGDLAQEYALIREGYETILPKIKKTEQREAYIASTFRMLLNGNIHMDWFLPYIATEYGHYQSIPLMEKLGIFKEYMGLLEQEKFRFWKTNPTLSKLYGEILSYYETSAIAEIEQEELKQNNIAVGRRAALTAHKPFIRKMLEKEKHIDDSKTLYMSRYQTLKDAGQQVEALDALMLYMDECSSPYCTAVQHPVSQQWCLAAQVLDSVPYLFQPFLAPDRIHLLYVKLPLMAPSATKSLRDDMISETIDIAIEQWNTLKNHPYKIDSGIHLAHLLLRLNRRDEAEKFYQYYKEKDVKLGHFADWMRDEIRALELEFSKKTQDA